jgi:N-acetylglucosaminyldiphosphoundecaprenol N-acetyl-beta-D-mannosaminyltransferase
LSVIRESAPTIGCQAGVAYASRSDLSREVYSVMGLPIDDVDLQSVVSHIKTAARASRSLHLSTPNVNFLVICQSDRAFWESLLLSDLCPPDGKLIVWIARLVGIPLRTRVAGSDIFAFLKATGKGAAPLKVFLFGGAEGVAEKASQSLNASCNGMACVGSIYPGFGTIEDLSRNEYIDRINTSGADFLVVSLGAIKGQAWLRRNRQQVRVPVRSHLGATINFEAGRIKRAPAILQYLGAEWLWRIKEEPYLWTRYFYDGIELLRLLLVRILPLAIEYRWIRFLHIFNDQGILITRSEDLEFVTLRIFGDALAGQVGKVKHYYRSALAIGKSIKVDLSGTRTIDARQIGLLLMVKKCLEPRGLSFEISNASSRVRRILRLNGLEFLCAHATPPSPGNGPYS